VTRLRILLNLRTTVLILGTVTVLGGIGILVWANQTGLPDQWRATIEDEIAKHGNGTTASIGSLSYIPLRGIIAKDVELFDAKNPGTRTAYLQRVVLDLDLPKLLDGIVKVERLELSDARISLPTNPGAPELVIEHANGRILMSAGRTIEVRDASGMIGGIRFDFGARVLGYGPGLGDEEAHRAEMAARRLLIARIAEELQHWSFSPDDPPLIKVFVEGEIDDPGAMRVDLSVHAKELEKGGYSLRRLEFDGELAAGILSIPHLRASDDFGTLDARLDYDPAQRRGKFSGSSDLDATRLIRAFFELDSPPDFSFSSPPMIEGGGSFHITADQAPDWNFVGRVSSGPFLFRGSAFDGFTTRVSATPDAAYIREVDVRLGDSFARGKILIRDRIVRYQVDTNFPVDHCRPFFADLEFGRVLDDIETTPGTKVRANVEGMADLDDVHLWSCGGKFSADEIRYRGVALHHVDAELKLDNVEQRYEQANATFDDRSYPPRRGSPSKPSAKLDALVINLEKQTTTVNNLRGRFWPGQLSRMFDTNLAKHLEEYRFHSPPETTSSGTIDLGNGGSRTDYRCTIRSNGIIDFDFLNKQVPLTNVRADVRVRGNRSEISDLRLNGLGGEIAGDITTNGRGSGSATSGELHWSDLSLPEIARIYQFEKEGGGTITGRLRFTGNADSLRELRGQGSVALEDGELFAVPIFGPLSPLISGVLGSRKAGFETARDAFCTFTIDDGLLTTRDFHTQTTSVDMTGDGSVDLDTKTIDMTMRLDARGFLGIITLPLRPFAGLFQFRGTGPLVKPKWRTVMFTAPSEGPDPAVIPKATPVGEPPRAVPVDPPDKPSPGRRPVGRPGRRRP